MSFVRFIYCLFVYLAIPFVLSRLIYRSLRAPLYAMRWGERFGFISLSPRNESLIWIHAVSVGETLAAAPIVAALKSSYPKFHILVTCMTPTGSEMIKTIFGDTVMHCYAPYDIPDAIARFLGRSAPSTLIVMETELWPNMIAACHARNIPVIVANGRLSQKSATGYSRIGLLAKPMFGSLHSVAAQSADDADRFIALGSSVSSVSVTGNIKFDMTIEPKLHAQATILRESWQRNGKELIWLAASTHPGEDEIILDAFKKIKRRLDHVMLVITPRHPERFTPVYRMAQDTGLGVLRCSKITTQGFDADILIGDTMGELIIYYGASDIAFVGGSLVPIGGHNMIEPAAWEKPIISGPYIHNFNEVAKLLYDAEALAFCETADELASQVMQLCEDEEAGKAMGRAAARVVKKNRGALIQLMALVSDTL